MYMYIHTYRYMCVYVCYIYVVWIWMDSNSVKSVVPTTHSGLKVIFTVEYKVFSININVKNVIEFCWYRFITVVV